MGLTAYGKTALDLYMELTNRKDPEEHNNLGTSNPMVMGQILEGAVLELGRLALQENINRALHSEYNENGQVGELRQTEIELVVLSSGFGRPREQGFSHKTLPLSCHPDALLIDHKFKIVYLLDAKTTSKKDEYDPDAVEETMKCSAYVYWQMVLMYMVCKNVLKKPFKYQTFTFKNGKWVSSFKKLDLSDYVFSSDVVLSVLMPIGAFVHKLVSIRIEQENIDKLAQASVDFIRRVDDYNNKGIDNPPPMSNETDYRFLYPNMTPKKITNFTGDKEFHLQTMSELNRNIKFSESTLKDIRDIFFASLSGDEVSSELFADSNGNVLAFYKNTGRKDKNGNNILALNFK